LAAGIHEETVRLAELLEEVENRFELSGPRRQASTMEAASSDGATRPLSILVADDNFDSATTLAICLRMDGHTVVVAHDGEQAMVMAETEHPQVMLLDVSMPAKDGYQVARELRARKWGAQPSSSQ
jgi:PleD family two-component response regulator